MTLDSTPRQATSADVAREAGVSRTTVSYVLNGTATLPDATRRKVLDAAERLGYAPSAAARILRRGRSDLVVLVLPDWPIGYAAGRTIELLSKGFAEHGLPVVTYQMNSSADQWPQLWKTLTPAAVISHNALDPADEQAMRAAGIRTVIGLYADVAGGSQAMHDSAVQVGRLQVEYLAGRGHRRLGYALPDSPRLGWYAGYRLEGARLACADLGLDEPDVQTVGPDERKARAAIDTWRTRRQPITAVAAYNDEIAIALMSGIVASGLTVPDDIAVIGVDDIPLAALTTPALTTVDVALGAMAQNLIGRTLDALGGEKRRRPRKVPASMKVVARQSA